MKKCKQNNTIYKMQKVLYDTFNKGQIKFYSILLKLHIRNTTLQQNQKENINNIILAY